MSLIVDANIQIADSEFELSYARSSGPGGQNVNKVNSKAILRWNIVSSRSLSLEVRSWLANRLAGQLTSDGDLVISSDRYRDQIRNREDCFQKLKELIAAAAQKPKARKKTKPSRSSQKRALEMKTKHSSKKASRRFKDYD
jgi:ribosome-associated protein